jgi:general secretion pathway protein A
MDYFTILNLNREPFSNSPDPDYFYHSRQHLDCLQKLELSLHPPFCPAQRDGDPSHP